MMKVREKVKVDKFFNKQMDVFFSEETDGFLEEAYRQIHETSVFDIGMNHLSFHYHSAILAICHVLFAVYANRRVRTRAFAVEKKYLKKIGKLSLVHQVVDYTYALASAPERDINALADTFCSAVFQKENILVHNMFKQQFQAIQDRIRMELTYVLLV